MDNNPNNLEKTLENLKALTEQLTLIEEGESELKKKYATLSERINTLFNIERRLEERLSALQSLLSDLEKTLGGLNDLEASLEATSKKLEKLQPQELMASLEKTSDQMAKTEKALTSASKREKEAKDKGPIRTKK